MTGTLNVVLEKSPSASDLKFIEQNLNRFNETVGRLPKSQPVAVFIRDTSDQIVGGLTGWTIGSWFRIRNMWIDESIRGQGFGSSLLAAAEREAISRGCKVADLTTADFHSPGFYTSNGYHVFGQLDDIGYAHTLYFMRKKLA